MRIGILTLPLHANYGGILQAYALQTVLRQMGHEVSLIEERQKPARLPWRHAPVQYGKRIVKNFLGRRCPVFYEQKVNRERAVVRQHTERFIDTYIRRRLIDDFREIAASDYEEIIVGSDQIWRPAYFPQIEHAYLDFAENWDVRRVAYAASFGTDVWEYTPEQTRRCGDLLKKFDAVSVRESSGVALCKERFGVRAGHVLDPTMLLSAADYKRLIENRNMPEREGILFSYFLDETPEKKAWAGRMAKEKRLVPCYMGLNVENFALPLDKRIQPPVEQWISGLYDAEFVVTDSFHACVFSLIFNKPFVVIGNRGRGMPRFASLLGKLGLIDRLWMGVPSCSYDFDEIDWRKINDQIGYEREVSKRFLECQGLCEKE